MMIDLGLNNEGDHLYAKQIRQGDKYGLNDCLRHKEPEPMVEFYVMADDKPWFVSRYYRSTLIGECEWSIGADSRLTGLCLCGTSNLCATATQVSTACSVSEASREETQ